jgi:hypothetical protein
MMNTLACMGTVLWLLLAAHGQTSPPETPPTPPPSPSITSPAGAEVFDVTAIAKTDHLAALDGHVARVNASGAFARRSGNTVLIHGSQAVRTQMHTAMDNLLDALSATPPATQPKTIPSSPLYTSQPPTRDGIGTVFLGREISQVMGHLGAEWLERPQREQEERTDLLVGMLPLKRGAIVADIGAGSGYFTSRLSPRVSGGTIIATDIQPEMLTMLQDRIAKEGLTNVQTILGTVDDTGLERASVDLILLVDVYHEFDHPWEMLQSMRRSLKDGGRVAIVEYRANDPTVPIKPLHTMTQEQVILEFELAGYTLESVQTDLPRQRLFLFLGN